MLDVGLALEYKTNPYKILRVERNKLPNGGKQRREIEKLLKQDKRYLQTAVDYLLRGAI